MNSQLLGATALTLLSAMPASAQTATTAPEQNAQPAAAAEVGVTASPAPQDATLGDIVVTAQKRAENVQNIPISIAAFAGEQLRDNGVTNIQDIVRVVPNFTISRGSQVANVRINIRGVGASTGTAVEPSVATFVDDVYVPRPGSISGRFFDLEALEVLRGPQGTLFGRNASVGALNIHTKRPTDTFEGYINSEASSFGTYETQGAVNFPLRTGIALRVAGIAATTRGFGYTTQLDRRIGQTDTFGGRASLKLEPTSNITWLIRSDYVKNTGDGQIFTGFKPNTVTPTAAANFTARLGGIAPDFYSPFDRVNNNYADGHFSDRQYGISSDASLEFGKGYTLRLINSYRDWRQIQFDADVTFSPRPLLPRDSQFTSTSQNHELQFISPKGAVLDGRLDFVSGLYYFRENYTVSEAFRVTDDSCNYLYRYISPALVAPCLAGPRSPATLSNFNQTTESYAAYLQTTLAITDRLDVVLGGRYTDDKKTGHFVQQLFSPVARFTRAAEDTSLAFGADRFTYRLGLNFRPANQLLFFASYSTGFKSGGFNSSGNTTALGQGRIFGSETVKNYEIGAKTTLFDKRLLLNATFFRMDIANYQDRAFDGVSFRVINAASLRQQGVEFDSAFHVGRDVRLNAAVAYLDSAFLSYPAASNLPAFTGTQDLTGTRNNFSPKFQGSVGAEFSRPLTQSGYRLSLRYDMSFTSASNIGAITDNNPQTVQNAFQLFNVRLRITSPNERASLSLFGENILDKGYCTALTPQPLDSVYGVRDVATGGTAQRCVVGTPRRLGARVAFKF